MVTVMKNNNSILKTDGTGVKAGKNANGFILLVIFPLFLIALILETVIVGSLSYGINVLSYCNKMEQAYSVLEDSSILWQTNYLPGTWKDSEGAAYEQVVTTRDIGPYILMIKELKDEKTGQILVNREVSCL